MIRSPAIPGTCDQCGAPINRKRNSTARFCSYECKTKWHNRTTPRRQQHMQNWWLQKKFGITLKEFTELAEKQDHRCAICKTDTPQGRGTWHVDHDHLTGENRGLLCHNCNLALGHFQDDPEILRAAIDYLSDYTP